MILLQVGDAAVHLLHLTFYSGQTTFQAHKPLVKSVKASLKPVFSGCDAFFWHAHFPFSLGSIIDEDRLRLHPKGLSQAINRGKAKVPLGGVFVSLCSTSDSAVRPKPQLACFGQGGLTQLPFSAKEFNLRKIDAKHIVLHTI
jgi:hypothetical protein